MQLHAGLLVAICEHPADDEPRMVMADWLDDNGQPERAEFIRLQLFLAKEEQNCGCQSCVERRGGGQHNNGPCEARYLLWEGPTGLVKALYRQQVLLAGGWSEWAAPLVETLSPQKPTLTWHRGFPDSANVELWIWTQKGPDAVKLAPLERIQPIGSMPFSTVARWYGWSVDDEDEGRPYYVPHEIYAQLEPDEGRVLLDKRWETSVEAVKALGRAAIRWARKAASLPVGRGK
jgi:uncharacterized protein (TIGR02996 family)